MDLAVDEFVRSYVDENHRRKQSYFEICATLLDLGASAVGTFDDCEELREHSFRSHGTSLFVEYCCVYGHIEVLRQVLPKISGQKLELMINALPLVHTLMHNNQPEGLEILLEHCVINNIELKLQKKWFESMDCMRLAVAYGRTACLKKLREFSDYISQILLLTDDEDVWNFCLHHYIETITSDLSLVLYKVVCDASKTGNIRLLCFLLHSEYKHLCNVNVKVGSETLLTVAVKSNFPVILEKLLKANANLTNEHSGVSALNTAVNHLTQTHRRVKYWICENIKLLLRYQDNSRMKVIHSCTVIQNDALIVLPCRRVKILSDLLKMFWHAGADLSCMYVHSDCQN